MGSVTAASPGTGPSASRRRDELGSVEELDGQPRADLHDPGVHRRIRSGAARNRPNRTPRRNPNSSTKGIGVTTLPLDFDIFLSFGSRTHPLRVVSCQGRASCSRWDRSVVEKSHVLDDLGPLRPQAHREGRGERAGSSPHTHAICGVSDEVAQVSMMSGSPRNPPGTPRWSDAVARRHVSRRIDGQARLVRHDRPRVVRDPVQDPRGYHTGTGTPK